MKSNRLIFAGTGLAAVGLAIFTAFSWNKDAVSMYHPSAKVEIVNGNADGDNESANDAGQWWFNRVKNQNTGQLDLEDMARVNALSRQTFAQAASARNSNPNSTASTSWTELGPDNVGGRTRAILFDKMDATHQHMFAGGVSGGLWESNDAGNNWHKAGNFFTQSSGVTITVVTIAQSMNGDLYVGTGEGNFYYLFGFGAGAFIGDGIYKSTDDGATWSVLPSTQPTTQNSVSTAWLAVNKIQCDPTNNLHIYAGTNKGFKESLDGGATWSLPNGAPAGVSPCTDIQLSTSGDNVIAVIGAKPYLSLDHGASFVNVGTAALGFTNAALGRTTVSISPQDPNYVYALCAASAGSLYGLYASIDAGQHWTQVSGAGNQSFDPFSSGGQGQGDYDNVISVDPNNKMRAVIGAVDAWEWVMITTSPIAGQWNQISSGFGSLFNPTYVHSDKHCITWHPTQAGVFYIGCDGGIFRTTNNGLFYQAMNAGYNVTQCYSVAIENTAGLKNEAVAGCQDNGTQFIDGTGNTAMSATPINGGDGAQCEISFLNPSGVFSTVYFGALARSNNRGSSSSQFYDARIQALPGFGTSAFASFTTPIRLWESSNDLLSPDSILIINDTLRQNVTVTNGDSAHYNGTLIVPIPVANPSATIILSSAMFVAGPDTLISNGAGNITGDGTGTIMTNGVYSITFTTTPPANRVIKAIYNVQYNAGTVFTVNSNVQGRTINYTTASTVLPNDTVKIQDVFQSRLAVGFTGNSGIWVTRQAIDFSATPFWMKIGGSHSTPDAYGGEADVLAWSPDGNSLYVGTGGQAATGNLYRFDNVGTVNDSISGDVDNASNANPSCQVRCTRIAGFGAGRAITGIDIDPNNPDKIMVTLGNYGNTNYVYYGTTASTMTTSSNTSQFTNKTGNLPTTIGGVPVYSCAFDMYVNKRALVGTEHGMFETIDITAANVNWVPANNGLDNVPVDMIRQQRNDAWLVPNAGCFYIGTHGRGMWRDDSSFQPTGIFNPTNPSSNGSDFINNHDLRVFPNPVVDNSHVSFLLGKAGDANVQIFDLTGKMVYSKNYEQLGLGANTVEFETQDLVKGTYIIVVYQDSKMVGSGRFVKMN